MGRLWHHLSENTQCGLVARSFRPSAPSNRCGSLRENMTSRAQQLSTGSASEGLFLQLVSQSNLLLSFCKLVSDGGWSTLVSFQCSRLLHHSFPPCYSVLE